MNAAPETTEIILALRLFRTNVAARDRAVAVAAHLKESDLTVLDLLHREGPQTPTALARRTNTHLATMTGVLTRLEREGWIERDPDASDRRSIQVRATSVERFNALYADSIEELQAVFDRWSPERRRVFLSSITDIARSLESRSATGASGR